MLLTIHATHARPSDVLKSNWGVGAAMPARPGARTYTPAPTARAAPAGRDSCWVVVVFSLTSACVLARSFRWRVYIFCRLFFLPIIWCNPLVSESQRPNLPVLRYAHDNNSITQLFRTGFQYGKILGKRRYTIRNNKDKMICPKIFGICCYTYTDI